MYNITKYTSTTNVKKMSGEQDIWIYKIIKHWSLNTGHATCTDKTADGQL